MDLFGRNLRKFIPSRTISVTVPACSKLARNVLCNTGMARFFEIHVLVGLQCCFVLRGPQAL